MEDKKTFGNFIASRRKELGITQKGLAEKIYVTESAVSKWERGITYPDISLVKNICEALSVSESELFASSLDLNRRNSEKFAAKYLRLVKGYRVSLEIAYSIALVVCFICNIAISHKLDWFFIVLTSIGLAASVTLLPAVIEKKKLLYTVGSFTITLILLLFTCALYTHGTWFFEAVIGSVLGLSTVFLPIILFGVNLPDSISHHKGLISMVIDTVLLFLIIFAIGRTNNITGYWHIAVPITLVGIIYPWILFLVIRYLKFNGLVKAGICTLFSGIYASVINDLINYILYGSFNLSIVKAELLNWTEMNINSNVNLIIVLVCAVLTVVFLAVGIKNRRIYES